MRVIVAGVYWITLGCGGQTATTTHAADGGAASTHVGGAVIPAAAPGGVRGVTAEGGVVNGSSGLDGVAGTGGTTDATGGFTATGGSSDFAMGGSGNVQEVGGGGAGGSGGSRSPDRCSLPMWDDTAPNYTCDGYMWRYWHNPTTGLCQLYFYGGCGATWNSFTSWRECVDTCSGQNPAAGLDGCTVPADCVAANPFCLETVCSNPLGDFVGVNRQQLGELQRRLSCSYVPRCDHGDTGATCQAGVCVTVKVWQSDLSVCSTDSDCALRYGVDCCEACDDNLSAINPLHWETFAESCQALALDCGTPCGPYPPRTSARCLDSHCFVVYGDVGS
jgi:hypothetical protein